MALLKDCFIVRSLALTLTVLLQARPLLKMKWTAAHFSSLTLLTLSVIAPVLGAVASSR
jgi:hypothetical protein